MFNIADILIKLCDLPGPAGFEEQVTAHVKKLIETYMDETYFDVLGKMCSHVLHNMALLNLYSAQHMIALTTLPHLLAVFKKE